MNIENTRQLFDLTSRVAIVTGGSGLLAYEHMKALADFGAIVVLADLYNKEKMDVRIAELNIDGEERGMAAICDVTKKEDWEALRDTVIEKFGHIDILLNNAGFTNQSQTPNFNRTFENFPLEDWNNIINVNLTGTFLGCQIIGNEMLAQGNGSIINFASLYGVVSPNHNIYPDTGISQPVAYSVSKGAVVTLTRYLAALWAAKGVRVNSITPGGIFNGHNEIFTSRFGQLNPIGRMSDKSELRGAIAYLASDASSHMIGHNLVVDGGWTIW